MTHLLLFSIQFDLSGDNLCYLAGILISFRWVECSVNQTKQWQRIVYLQQATSQSAECCQCAKYQYSSTWNGHIRQADTDCFLRPWEGRWVHASFIVCTKVHIWFVYVCVCACSSIVSVLILFVTIVEEHRYNFLDFIHCLTFSEPELIILWIGSVPVPWWW